MIKERSKGKDFVRHSGENPFTEAAFKEGKTKQVKIQRK